MQASQTYSGWNTDQILEELMGVKSLENKLYAKLISEALGCFELANKDKLDQKIAELKKVAHPDDVIVTNLEIKSAQLSLK